MSRMTIYAFMDDRYRVGDRDRINLVGVAILVLVTLAGHGSLDCLGSSALAFICLAGRACYWLGWWINQPWPTTSSSF